MITLHVLLLLLSIMLQVFALSISAMAMFYETNNKANTAVGNALMIIIIALLVSLLLQIIQLLA